jgi:hypothetical protein
LWGFTECSGLNSSLFTGQSTSGGGIEAGEYPLVNCAEGLPVISESEPNDVAAEIQALREQAAPGFCIQGALLCGNDSSDYENDIDMLRFTVGKDASAAFLMKWAGASDMDFYLSGDGEQLISYVDGVSDNEAGQAELLKGSEYTISTGCWSGDSGGYSLSVTWD